jgi:hypothetical protein
MAQPAPRRGSGRSGLIRLGIVVGIVVVLAVGFWLFRDRLSGQVGDLQVGDCFDLPGNDTSITDVQHQPCGEPHGGEVILLITDPSGSDADYPASDHFRALAAAQCLPAASTYLNADFSGRLDLNLGFFYPTSDSWGNGDRGLTCYLYNFDGSQLTAPLKNSGPGST